jgi:NADH-quinone oxidoreductase subunit J
MASVAVRASAGFVASLFLLALVRFFVGGARASAGAKGMAAEVAADFGSTEMVATQLFTRYLLAFEVTGVLLLVTIVGAVVLAKRKLI